MSYFFKILKLSRSSFTIKYEYKSFVRFSSWSGSSTSSFSHDRNSLLFLGAPGVGKGTFGKLIAPHFNAQLMTSSDLLRDAADACLQTADVCSVCPNSTAIENGKYIKECIATGKLVSDDIVIPIVIDFLRVVSGSFIFDGFPRTLQQAERLQSEYPLDLGIYFKLPHHILVNKMLGRRVCSNSECNANYNVCQINEGDIVMPSMEPKISGICDKCESDLEIRIDDTLEIIEERLRIFYQQNNPIVEYYEACGLLLQYDVKKGIDDVADILSKIQKRLKCN